MAAIIDQDIRNPLLVPEIVGLVIDYVRKVPDLLNCACVSKVWNAEALRKLYVGSMNDMKFRTADIGSLNSLFVASRQRFARNMTFVKHLVLSPETPAIDESVNPWTRLVCFEKCRALRDRKSAELVFRPKGRGLASLTIPYEIINQDWSFISDIFLSPTVEYLAIDNIYCEVLMAQHSTDFASSFVRSPRSFHFSVNDR
ncbi:hypothetical protein F1880_005514 [Penicillium rolfsii]|nr:hypothetical protein F1880_005514 [Penicillium rolfsii]